MWKTRIEELLDRLAASRDQPRPIGLHRLQQVPAPLLVGFVADLHPGSLQSKQRLAGGIRIALSLGQLRPPPVGSLLRLQLTGQSLNFRLPGPGPHQPQKSKHAVLVRLRLGLQQPLPRPRDPLGQVLGAILTGIKLEPAQRQCRGGEMTVFQWRTMCADPPTAIASVLCPEVSHQVVCDRIRFPAIGMQSPQGIAGVVGTTRHPFSTPNPLTATVEILVREIRLFGCHFSIDSKPGPTGTGNGHRSQPLMMTAEAVPFLDIRCRTLLQQRPTAIQHIAHRFGSERTVGRHQHAGPGQHQHRPGKQHPENTHT